MGKETLEWTENLTQSKTGSINTTTSIPNSTKYLGLSLTGARTASTILTMIFFIGSLSLLVLYIRRQPEHLPRMEKESLQLSKKYGERMAQATEQAPTEGGRLVTLGTMEDLIKVADELGKPVIYQPPTAPQGSHIYYVFDGNIEYQYILPKR